MWCTFIQYVVCRNQQSTWNEVLRCSLNFPSEFSSLVVWYGFRFVFAWTSRLSNVASFSVIWRGCHSCRSLLHISVTNRTKLEINICMYTSDVKDRLSHVSVKHSVYTLFKIDQDHWKHVHKILACTRAKMNKPILRHSLLFYTLCWTL